MEKIKPTLEQKGELAAVPIFRSNDLYDALFPEITPIFKKGEEPNAKQIFEVIASCRDQAIVLDNTCYETILDTDKVTINDLPQEFELQEIPEDAWQVDLRAISELFKEKFSVDMPFYGDKTIDRKIDKALGQNFSPELAVGLLEIAKQKNHDIKRVYILSANISDHVGNFPKENVADLLKDTVQKEFGIEPNVVATISATNIVEGDLIIVDRHNPTVSFLKLNETLPRQISLLPIETELFNNEQFLGEEIQSNTLVAQLRKNFEK